MNKLIKAAVVYVFIGAAAFIFAKIYALFSHGVNSGWMDNMYLAVLLLGSLLFLLLRIFAPGLPSRKGYRLFFNVYGSGVAVLVNAMLLKGILNIAGGTSSIVPWFFYTACVILGTGVVLLGRLLFGAR